jgi:predicted DNA-binding transcriptional regulator AlpA
VILALQQIAAETGISLRTLQRSCARGDGPPIIQLSPRRIGVDEAHYRAWLEARRIRSPRAQAAA